MSTCMGVSLIVYIQVGPSTTGLWTRRESGSAGIRRPKHEEMLGVGRSVVLTRPNASAGVPKFPDALRASGNETIGPWQDLPASRDELGQELQRHVPAERSVAGP